MKICTVLTRLLLPALYSMRRSDAYTNPIVIKNYKMYDAKSGMYIGVRGVDYYPRPSAGTLNTNNRDFFTDEFEELVWKKDLENLAALGANAVRLGAVDPSKSHDKFMCAVRSYGIYALVDMPQNCEGCAITIDAAPRCYPELLKTRGQQIINAFAKYDNVLAFSAGNEINHVASTITDNAPCQKKFIRDMRAYIASCDTLRKIPVGVVLADSADERELNAKYYNCRTNSSDIYENAEWYGLNVYQYCDGTVTDMKNAAGFQKLLSDFYSYKMNIPVMLTEFGCLHPSFPPVEGYDGQRTWLQAGWLHSAEFRQQFNGGFAFEYSTEMVNTEKEAYPFSTFDTGSYGLGYFSPVTCDHTSGNPCTFKTMPNYQSLAKQYNATSYADEPHMDKFSPDQTKVNVPECPTGFPSLDSITWTTDTTVALQCPATAQEYTCPNQKTSGTWTVAGSAGGSATMAPPSTSSTPVSSSPPTGTTTNTTSGKSDATAVVGLAFVTTCAAASTLLVTLP